MIENNHPVSSSKSGYKRVHQQPEDTKLSTIPQKSFLYSMEKGSSI